MEGGEWKPNVETTPHCPRCGSCNTKFCYYNNYSLTQPRYFCKGCRRYWTKGGSLRNVPVGGGCRKSRRGKSVRISSDRISSRVFGYESSTVQPSGYGGNSMVELDPTHGSNVPNIDLAQVYANFLNQPPRATKCPEQQPEQADTILGPSFHFGMVSDMHTDFGASLPFENGLVEYDATLQHRSSEPRVDDGDAMFLSGLDLVPKQLETFQQFTSDHDHTMLSNHGLPPLPGEEGLWPDSRAMVTHHSMQLPEIEPGAPISGELIGNKIPLDLPDYGVFFRH